MEKDCIGRRYRHFKGNEYEIVAVAKDSETLEPLVVYKALYGEGQVWVRPYEMFFETIERNGNVFKRFEEISWITHSFENNTKFVRMFV